jgi:hypothetical protein
VTRLLLVGFGVAALACAGTHRSDRIPEGHGPLIAVYKTSIDDGQNVARGAKLAVWAESPDRLHAELIAPVGGLAYILDAGNGRVCVVDVAASTAYLGQDGPGAIEAFAGVRVSVTDAVAALLNGASPAGLVVTRVGQSQGALPKRLRIDDGPRSLELERVRFERGRSDPATLGTGAPPAHLVVRPLADLGPGPTRELEAPSRRR